MPASRILRKGLCLGLLLSLVVPASAFAQKALTWQEVRAKFEALNPTLRAGLIGIDESKASEISAFLRPNPDLTLSSDGTQILRGFPPTCTIPGVGPPGGKESSACFILSVGLARQTGRTSTAPCGWAMVIRHPRVTRIACSPGTALMTSAPLFAV